MLNQSMILYIIPNRSSKSIINLHSSSRKRTTTLPSGNIQTNRTRNGIDHPIPITINTRTCACLELYLHTIPCSGAGELKSDYITIEKRKRKLQMLQNLPHWACLFLGRGEKKERWIVWVIIIISLKMKERRRWQREMGCVDLING